MLSNRYRNHLLVVLTLVKWVSFAVVVVAMAQIVLACVDLWHERQGYSWADILVLSLWFLAVASFPCPGRVGLVASLKPHLVTDTKTPMKNRALHQSNLGVPRFFWGVRARFVGL